MTFQRFLRFLGGLLAVLIIAACTPGTIRQGTPTPEAPEVVTTERPDSNHTEIPFPGSNTWQAEPVLITLQTSPGFTSENYAWATGPDLIVYANGTVIYSIWSETSTEYEYAPVYYSAQISNQELCKLLLQIEGGGFFDLSQDDYHEPQISDNGYTFIIINSWRSKSIIAYALSYAVSDEAAEYGEAAPEALKDTFLRLNAYRPANAGLYQPEKVSLLISAVENDIAAELWSLADPDLNRLAGDLELDEANEIVIEGQAATNVSELFTGDLTKYFEIEGKIFSVTIRPLFPHEIYEKTTGWGRLSFFERSPTVQLSCVSKIKGIPEQPDLPPTVTAVSQQTSSEPSNLVAPLEFIGEVGARNEPGQINFSAAILGTPDGNILVADPGNDRFQLFSLDGELKSIIPLLDISPESMAYAPNGNLVIANWWQNVIQLLSPNGEELLATYIDWPEPEGGIEDPTDHIDLLAVGPDGRIYTGERVGGRVVILDSDGNFLEEWRGPTNNPLDDIWDLDTDAAGTLYIITRDQDRIVKRLPDGQTETIRFEYGLNLAVRPDGSFFASDDNTIALFDSDGTKVTDWTDSDLDIRDMTVASDGSVIIQSGSLHQETEPVFYRYDENGKLLSTFGTTLVQPGQFKAHVAFSVSPAGDIWVVAASDNSALKLVHIDPQDNHLNTFATIGDLPLSCDNYSLAALANQSVLVGDSCEGAVTLVNAEGEVVTQWGERGTGPGQINLLADLALAPDGQSLYLVDSANGRITQFTFDGQPLAAWDKDQLGVREPIALAIASDGTLFMVDGTTGEVVIRPSQGESIKWLLPVSNELPNDIAIDEARQRIYVGGTDINLYVFDYNGEYLGRTRISDSSGVMVNVGPNGNVYRSTGFQEIQVYRPTE